jgi:CDP-4-dehydro-6-deoxyglucose reductase, E1
MKIPLMKNAFLHEKETREGLANFILTAPRLSMDENCFKFEDEFKIKQKRSDAILYNSGGSANLALLQALKNMGRLKVGDKIGFSALTWSTNVMPIIQLGFIPIPLDVEPNKLNVMSHHLEKLLKNETLDAFFVTNVLGFAGDLHKIKSICNENNIILLEDNCESLGSELLEGKTGNFSLAATFSFYVAHHMSTIEGGMICTDDEELGAMLRIVRANGWDRNLTDEQKSKIRFENQVKNSFEANYSFYDLGFNLRPTEITGYLGLEQLKYLDETVDARVKNFSSFLDIIERNDELMSFNTSGMKKISSFAFPIICKTPEFRKKYIKIFQNSEIEIRPIIAGNMLKQPFYSLYANNNFKLEGADFIHKCGFYCGNYPELTNTDLNIIWECLG